MKVTDNLHQQFAQYFDQKELEPYLYLLSKKLSEGHICINPAEWLGQDVDELYNPQKMPSTNHALVSDGTVKKPLIYFNNQLYLQRYFAYETTILEKILQLIRRKNPRATHFEVLELKDLINRLFPATTGEIDWQLVAVLFALLQNFMIITGGPGTGKTTTVAKILTVLYHQNPRLRVALAAPTGKAAARMAESLKNAASGGVHDEKLHTFFAALEPSTIHRLLGYIKNSIYFKHNKNNPLPYDVLIIDESSMIDIALFSKLMEALPEQCKIIFLGDKNQLASVEAGSMFGELCTAQRKLNIFSAGKAELLSAFMPQAKSEIERRIEKSLHPLFEHVIELEKSHRFSANTGIGKLSKAIIEAETHKLQEFLNSPEDEVVIDMEYSTNIFKQFVTGYEDYIAEVDVLKALEKFNGLRILCATREGEFGMHEANRAVEKYLQHKNLLKLKGDFYENRPVMVTQNVYGLDLFNGDIGLMRRNENGEIRVWFDIGGRAVGVHPASIPAMETVFAMTIHKSQGSEFNEVLVRLPGEDMELLTAELIYTAVTRARKKVVLQTSENTLMEGVKKRVERSSGIRGRMDLVRAEGRDEKFS